MLMTPWNSCMHAVEVGSAALLDPVAPLRIAADLDKKLDERHGLSDALAKGETWTV